VSYLISVEKIVNIPPDVGIEIDGRHVTVSGPKGDLTRDFSHTSVEFSREDSRLTVSVPWPRGREAAVVGTVQSHIDNMITGVREGFTYRLKMVFAHFPVSVRVEGDRVVIENFGGEREPRTAKILGSTEVSVEGDDVVVQGIDKEAVAQTAANIEQATRIRRKDPRVFLDGIYIYEKEIGM